MTNATVKKTVSLIHQNS